VATLITNAYCDRKAFYDYIAENGITDANDDNVIAGVLNGVSRIIDAATRGRIFFPRVATRLFSLLRMNEDWQIRRTLKLDFDLLEVATLLNGDGVAIASSEYYLDSPNFTPYHAIVLRESSSTLWQFGLSGDSEYVISVTGVWGYHDDWASAFVSRSLLTGNMTSSVTTAGVTTGTGAIFSNGMLVRVGTEYMAVDGVSTDTLTVRRGVNGSTAAAHSTGDTLYQYMPMTAIAEATKRIGMQAYRRFGQAMSGGQVQVTAAGVVITPKDIGPMDAQLLASLASRRI